MAKPSLSPEQEQGAAANKQVEQAQLQQEKQQLERAQDRVAQAYMRKTVKAGEAAPFTRASDTNMPKTKGELPRDAGPRARADLEPRHTPHP